MANIEKVAFLEVGKKFCSVLNQSIERSWNLEGERKVFSSAEATPEGIMQFDRSATMRKKSGTRRAVRASL
jgi:hypothetical protein